MNFILNEYLYFLLTPFVSCHLSKRNPLTPIVISKFSGMEAYESINWLFLIAYHRNKLHIRGNCYLQKSITAIFVSHQIKFVSLGSKQIAVCDPGRLNHQCHPVHLGHPFLCGLFQPCWNRDKPILLLR